MKVTKRTRLQGLLDIEAENKAREKLACAIAEAKQKRFTLSSRILTQKEVNVYVTNDELEHNPAWIDMSNLHLTLNEAYPKTDGNEIKALVYDRAKLYHELGHALFTTVANRDELCRQSRDPKLFLDVSNALEDGKIERQMAERFQGTQPFFDSFLAEMIKESIEQQGTKNPFASLVIYVRKKLMRNAADAAFWAPYLAKIDEAVACDNSERVNEIAFDIVEAIAKPKPEQPPKPPTQPTEPDKQDKQGEPKPAQVNGTGNGGGASAKPDSEPPQPEKLDHNGLTDAIREKLEKLVGEALKLTESEAKDEYNSILEEIAECGMQEYADELEQAASQQLSEILRSLCTETARSKDHQAKAGKLNSLALPKALTNKTCFNTVEDGKGKPHVALLLDISGSMHCRAHSLTSAARILNGALRASGIPTLTLTYGGRDSFKAVKKLSAIDADCPLDCGGGTPTGEALHVANDWLEKQNATRGLIINVTDGGPNDWEQVREEILRANNMNAHVLGVAVETDLEVVTSQSNAAIDLPNVSELPSALEQPLSDYINGAI